MILAAIDIGSNAARLLISSVQKDAAGKPVFSKIDLIRVPLRLGFDVFELGEISPQKQAMMIQTLKAYRHLMNAYHVQHYTACATSAMRDAKNAQQVITTIKKECGLDIEIISGEKEANLVYENHVAENMDKDHSYLYIDVGGGSTELSFFSNSILVYKHSFNIGTIRILKNQVEDYHWDEMKEIIKAVTKGHKEVVAIGSGGNINKLFSLSKKKEGKPLPLELLKEVYKEMSELSVTERMQKFNLREDRADVIVPALQIYSNAMRWAGAQEIYVPKIGLADGLIRHLYEEVTVN